MSAGKFSIASYEADYGAGTNVHGCRIQPETTAATIGAVTNQVAAGTTVTSPISAQISSSTKALGLHARIIRLKNPTAPPTSYTATSATQIPALSKAFYVAAQLPGATCNYLGTTWEVSGTRSEKVR